MRGRAMLAAVALVGALVAAAPPLPAAVVQDRTIEALSRKLFPVLSALGAPRTVQQLRARPALAAVLAERAQRTAACRDDLPCVARAALWSERDAAALSGAVTADLVPRAVVPDDGVSAGLAREIAGLNSIVEVYALGTPPRYPAIDGPGIAPDTPEAKTRLAAAVALRTVARTGSAQALDPSVELALALLDTNDRTDAIGFEPIDGGDNAAAMARAKRLDWNLYHHTAILLTGIGPETLDTPLSAGGKYHVRLAAQRFADGDAPFIIVSGGRAHPRGAAFAEAVEMRRALIERYGVPANAIVLEPYARHTTTNLRNATRRLIALGAPLDRDTLIVCNAGQSAYIESAVFTARNQRELGYQPGTIGKRLSPTELEFRPAAVSARVDPLDPLDP